MDIRSHFTQKIPACPHFVRLYLHLNRNLTYKKGLESLFVHLRNFSQFRTMVFVYFFYIPHLFFSLFLTVFYFCVRIYQYKNRRWNVMKRKILIVDDEQAIADLVEVYLSNEGMEV